VLYNPAMKTILTTLFIGALALTACGKDKKPSTTEPTAAEPAKADPKADPAAAADPNAKPADPKPAEKTGW
jgi:hypothetical protein